MANFLYGTLKVTCLLTVFHGLLYDVPLYLNVCEPLDNTPQSNMYIKPVTIGEPTGVEL